MACDFLYDYQAVAEADISQWADSFFWPVSKEEIARIVEPVFAMCAGLSEQLDDPLARDTLSIAIRLRNVLSVLSVHYLAVSRLLAGGHTVRTGPAAHCTAFFAKGQPLPPIGPENLWSLAQRNRVLKAAHTFAKSTRFNRRRGMGALWNHALPGRCVAAAEHPSVLDRPFTLNHPDWVRLITPEAWLRPGAARPLPQRTADLLHDAAQQICAFVETLLHERFGLDLPAHLAAGMRQTSNDNLAHVAQVYQSILDRMRRNAPRLLLTSTGGKTFNRMLSMAAHRTGTPNIGFPHSHFICHGTTPRPTYIEFEPVDAFMAYAPGSVPLFEAHMDMHPVPRKKRIEILHDDTPLYRDRCQEQAALPLPDRVKAVMVVAQPVGPEWGGFNTCELLVSYHFLYRLCRSLADNGYKVLLKNRPKGLTAKENIKLGEIPGLEIVGGWFEDPAVTERADAFVIYYGMSSTLHWAMCTNKPIVYADLGWDAWQEEPYRLLKKRCHVLKCGYDERNAIRFDERELCSYLEQKPVRPDLSYLERYLFPSPSTAS